MMTDFKQRMISGLIMVALGLAAIIIGGDIFFTVMAVLAVIASYEAYLLLKTWPIKFVVIVYILLGFGAAYYVRTNYGWVPFVTIASIVALTDMGGYFIGSRLQGPKLWPRISPKKTWSGSIGGLIISLITIYIIYSFALIDFMPLATLMGMTLIVSIAAQCGDLFESFLKRRAGVKDSSSLIPGHGGFLDRLDSWIGAFFVLGIVLSILKLL